jgi:hypothetical protein
MTDSAQEEMYYCDYLYYGYRQTHSSSTLRESIAYAMALIEDCAGWPRTIRQGSRVILEDCDYYSLEELYLKAPRGEI